MATKRELARDIIERCAHLGTTHVFGVPGGGSNLDVVGEAEAAGLQFVLTHTETAAAIMAGVAGEISGSPGLCLATRGPGAAAALNGVAQADLDRQPIILFTDSVAETDWDRISHQRINQQSLYQAVTRATLVLTGDHDPDPVALTGLATGHQPGAVHIDLDPGATPVAKITDRQTKLTTSLHETSLSDLLLASKRPVLAIGVGAIKGGDAHRAELCSAIAALAATHHLPVLCTYDAAGMIPTDHPCAAGLLTAATIEAPVLHEADLIIGIGLDPVEFIPAAWNYRAPVALLGAWPIVDSTYFGEHLHGEWVGDLTELTQQMTSLIRSSQWDLDVVSAFGPQAQADIQKASKTSGPGLDPGRVVAIARELAPETAIATVDAGAHMLPAMGLWNTYRPCELLISSGLATMGFSLPAAISAALHRPGTRVVALTGDGGLSMALAELETLARLGGDVTVVVFNDASLSLIAAKQAAQGHGGESAIRYRDIDYATVAEGLGMPGIRCEDEFSYREALTTSFGRSGPTLIDVLVDPSSYRDIVAAVRAPRS